MTELEKKYLDRYTKWQDKTREQLSFFNNLLLTISTGFLSFVITQEKYSVHLRVSTQELNFLMLFSILLVLSSILVGLLLVINRLYDFRITTHINQVRYWFKKKQKDKDEDSLDEKTPEKFCFCTRFFLSLKVVFKEIPRINIEDCEDYHLIYSEIEKREFKNKFRTLRNYTHNLGIVTWVKLKWQIGLFLLGILSFVIAQLFSI